MQARASSMSPLDLLQLLEHHRIFRLISNGMYIDIADFAVLIDDKYGAFGKALRSQDAVLEGSQTVRPKVAQERIGNAAQ